MNREDIHKLLGGYATGTLTPEEQQALFEAALHDQELFDALAREQSLRDLLREPAAKAWLLAGLDRKPLRWYQTLWGKTVAWTAPIATVVLAVLIWTTGREPKATLVARYTPPPVAGPQSTPSASEPAAPAPDHRGLEPKPALQQPVPETHAANMPSQAAPGASILDRREKAATPPSGAPEVDQRTLEKQKQAGPATEHKELAQADKDALLVNGSTTTPVIPAPVVAPAGTQGFRQTTTTPADELLKRRAAAPPPRPPAAAQPGTQAAPSPPPPIPAQAPSTQQQVAQAPSPAVQQAGQQGSMGGLPTRAQQTANSETLQVQAAASTVDTITGNDAKSLYYAAPAASVSAGKAAGAGGGGSGFNAARTAAGGRSKKAPTQEEQTLTNSKVETPHALNLGVKYVLLRKTAAGSFQAVDAERLQTGDTLELQLTPNDSGTLHVRARGTGGGWRDAFLRSVPAGQMYTVLLNPGDSELQVTLTRLTVTVAGAALRDDRSAVQRKSESDATYVVASPSATQLQFPITLNYK